MHVVHVVLDAHVRCTLSALPHLGEPEAYLHGIFSHPCSAAHALACHVIRRPAYLHGAVLSPSTAYAGIGISCLLFVPWRRPGRYGVCR